ncbi:MAG: DUF1080 domain-containing protein [Armatimonadota bacterium]|nr:DUF1080 domain-containing protein [bacterium]MDW8290042.1 DUF1080 domain-containing protein [Armatimonadota bacterium]
MLATKALGWICLLTVVVAGMAFSAQPLRVSVVVAGTDHDSAGIAGTLAWVLGRYDGVRFTVSKEAHALTQEIRRADVLVLFAPGTLLHDEQQQALRQFIARGGGVVYLHTVPSRAATEGTRGNVVVQVERPQHPTMQRVPSFQVVDAPVQVASEALADALVVARQRGGPPLAWVWREGRGKVFVTTLGHAPSAWSHPAFQKMVVNAVFWCAGRKPPQPPVPRPPKGFISLFNGMNLEGWGEVGTPCWSVQDGVIQCSGIGEGGGWLRSDRMYRNFVLRLEYRISPGGNSGIFLRAPHFGRSSRLGMELQILDDAGSSPSNTGTAAVYNAVAPRVNPAKPAGEWNQVEITLRDRHLRVVWNGQLVHDLNLDDPQTNQRLPRTHLLTRRPNSGYIGLQNHRSLVEFRNIFLREIQ